MNESSASVLRFDRTATSQWVGRRIALVASGALLLLSVAADAETPWRASAVAGLLVALLGGVVLMLRREIVEIDAISRTFFVQRRWLPARWAAREMSGKLDRFALADPGSQRACTVWAESSHGRFAVVDAGSRDEACDMASELHDRLQVPIQDIEALPPTQRRPGLRRAALLGSWIAMVAVTAVMVSPVLSGQRTAGRGSRGSGTREQQQSAEFLSDGLASYWRAQYVVAASQFRRAAEADPTNADALNMLAYAYAESGSLDAALRAADRALAVAPHSATIMDTVGEMHERRGEMVAAVTYYVRALAGFQSGMSTETHAKLGRTLLALHRPVDARGHLVLAARAASVNRWGAVAAELLKSPALRSAGPAPSHVRSSGSRSVPAREHSLPPRRDRMASL